MTAEKQSRDDVLAGAHTDTIAIRSGHRRTAEGEHGEPIFTTSSYVFDSAKNAADRFSGEEPGNVYSRYTNPTVRNFEERIAGMEGAEQAVATSSGMAAILSTCHALLQSGDHVVCSRSVFGTTVVLFNKFMAKFGVEVTFVEPTNLAHWKAAIQENTKFLFLETPSNPLCELVDLKALVDLAHSRGVLVVVDNCFCTPVLQQPIALGVDIVVHSATKYLDGQGRAMGGVVLGRHKEMDEVLGFLRAAGPTMSPFNAWIFLKGLETLSLRMKAHSDGATKLAGWLESQPLVETVFYAGLKSHPQYELASEQMTGFGGVLSFRVSGNRDAAWRFIDATRLVSITANLGDTKTTIIHPATTTHSRLTPEERMESGITDNLIRVAVVLEHINDLIEDMERGLSAV